MGLVLLGGSSCLASARWYCTQQAAHSGCPPAIYGPPTAAAAVAAAVAAAAALIPPLFAPCHCVCCSRLLADAKRAKKEKKAQLVVIMEQLQDFRMQVH
jgi:hypothetical protein